MTPTIAGAGQRLYNRARQVIPGGTQLLSKRPEMFLPEQWPAYFRRAQGACVWDLDGRQYTDVSHFSVGACPLGYADAEVNSAVKAVVDEGNISTLNAPEEVALAECLVDLHPWAQMARFVRGGGEAMSVAVRIARAFTGRSKVAFCGYHGWHDWYLAGNLGGHDALGGRGVHLAGLEPRGVPHELTGTALPFRFQDISELERILKEQEGQIAAIITEVQRGTRPTPACLNTMRQMADETGAVLIFDEITSGFRFAVGGAHMLYGVSPDLAVFAKAMGNGFPIGAVIGIEPVMQIAQESFISSTYWTERIGPAAALATIRRFRELDAPAILASAGTRVQQVWREGAVRHGVVVHVGPSDLPALSHMRFEHPQARAVQTLWCQLMLDRGYLDNAAFYATCAHTDGILGEYETAVFDVFGEISSAIREHTVLKKLRGPIGHTGFARLT